MIKVSCPGSCGELFQGIDGDEEFLLTYGIDAYSQVTLSPTGLGRFQKSLPDKMSKALQWFDPLTDLVLAHTSQLPVGKGCSSSTADLLSCLKAVSLAQKRNLSAQDLTKLCAQIEPTDSLAFANWTVINPLTGQLLWQTDWCPSLFVYLLEPVALIRTEELLRMSQSEVYDRRESAQLLPYFQRACQEKSVVRLGELATQSAILNDSRLPKPYLKDLIRLGQTYGLGLNIAHSGTVVGILLAPEQVGGVPDLEASIKKSRLATYYQKRHLHRLVYSGVHEYKEEGTSDEQFRADYPKDKTLRSGTVGHGSGLL